MKLTFLGTGTSTGVPQLNCRCSTCTSTDKRDKRLRSSVLIETGGKKLLIDCGPDFRQQALAASLQQLDAILITHEHYDHLGGLDDVRPYGKVAIYAEKRVNEHIQSAMPYCFKAKLYPGVPQLTLHEIDAQEFWLANIRIQPIRIFHAQLPILGFRIANMAYLTDLKTIEESRFEQLRGLDVLILNALRREKHIGHINLEEAIELAQKIAAKKTYFIHFSHDIGLHKDLEKELPPTLFMAYDELTINF
ncbi:MAG: MBL fold metallo-hydrolase [Porphyromonadaceae bacterium CG2_30_38_12]|nr:MAG: MBL fold metallo-hydrolase [Porphyromonadaceae bacterium CG2_30_38_12]